MSLGPVGHHVEAELEVGDVGIVLEDDVTVASKLGEAVGVLLLGGVGFAELGNVAHEGCLVLSQGGDSTEKCECNKALHSLNL